MKRMVKGKRIADDSQETAKNEKIKDLLILNQDENMNSNSLLDCASRSFIISVLMGILKIRYGALLNS